MVSVIIPVYNTREYLEGCVRSILRQTYGDIEVILVDDGATDGCGELCDMYASEDERVRVIHQVNQGLSAARNTGIEAARGEHLVFVDSDDYASDDMVEFLEEQMISNNADIAICGRWEVYEDGRTVCRHSQNINKVMDTEQALIELNSYGGFDMSAWAKIYKRELFDEIRFPVGKLCEDYYTCHKLFAKANIVSYSSAPKYYYFRRSGSISRNKKVNLASLDACMAQREFFAKNLPHLLYVAETACVFSQVAAYNGHIDRGISCPTELMKQLKKTARKYIFSALKNPHISSLKKLQAVLFVLNKDIYRLAYNITKKR